MSTFDFSGRPGAPSRWTLEQRIRQAVLDDDLMRRLRLICADHMRVEHMTNRDIVKVYGRTAARNARAKRHPAPPRPAPAAGPVAAAAPRGRFLKDDLKRLFTLADEDYLQRVCDDLNRDLPRYGLDTPLRRAHFLAQIREESGPKLQATVESLNYSAEGLKLFHYYKINPLEAAEDGYERDPKTKKKTRAADQEAIANKAYANRNGNGAAISGDGWRYRGRGLIQVTGRGNYKEITREYAKLYTDEKASSTVAVNFVSTPDLVAEFPYSLRSAVCFWNLGKLPALAQKGDDDEDVDRITRVVNRHTKSYGERRAHFRTAFASK